MNFLHRAFRFYIDSTRSEFGREWGCIKFDFIPTRNNLLESTWYKYQNNKILNRDLTILKFLDQLVGGIKNRLVNPELSPQKAAILKDFLDGLHDPSIRKVIVLFLEKAVFSREDARQIWDMIHAAWRTPAESAVGVMTETKAIQEETFLGPEKKIFLGPEKETPARNESSIADGQAPAGGFHAKTYVIATHIFFELAGKEVEYEALSHDLTLLEKFIREQFHIKKLPGTFSNLKGYSYKRILEGKNRSKKGQLKPCLRQILEHPQVFGEDISHHARLLYNEHFEE